MLRKRLMAVVLSAVMTAAIFTGCASKDDSSKSDNKSAKTEQQKSDAKEEKSKDSKSEAAKAPIEDGTYTAEFKTDSTMFHVNEANEGKGTLTVEDGKIKSIDNVLGDGDRKNKSYIGDATDGYDDYIGVVKQIVDANGTDEINAVSGATCSSNAIVNAVNDALEKATKKDENTVKTDGLQTAITKAESLTENLHPQINFWLLLEVDLMLFEISAVLFPVYFPIR